MLAEKKEAIRDGIVTLKQLSEDEKIQMQCEAREQLRRDFASATELGEKRGAVKIMQKYNFSEEEILENPKQQFDLTDEEAKKFLEG